MENIKKARDKDEKIVRIVEEMKKAKVKAIQGEECYDYKNSELFK